MEYTYNALRCRNKVADHNIANLPNRDIELSEARPNVIVNESVPGDNLNNSKIISKNVSERNKKNLNQLLRRPSRTNSITKIASKNFYKAKEYDHNNPPQ